MGMNEREEKIIQSVSKAISKMTEFEKGYFLGAAEAKLNEKSGKENEHRDSIAV